MYDFWEQTISETRSEDYNEITILSNYIESIEFIEPNIDYEGWLESIQHLESNISTIIHSTDEDATLFFDTCVRSIDDEYFDLYTSIDKYESDVRMEMSFYSNELFDVLSDHQLEYVQLSNEIHLLKNEITPQHPHNYDNVHINRYISIGSYYRFVVYRHVLVVEFNAQPLETRKLENHPSIYDKTILYKRTKNYRRV